MYRALGLLVILVTFVGCGGVTLEDLVTPRPVPKDACLVVGFLGGRDSWDDGDKGVRKLALELRSEKGIYAETFENRRRSVAEAFVVEAKAERLVVYGQSFGGAAVVKFARDLQKRGIEILLTLQIDSVGRDDATIPANVSYALNLYQDNGWFIRGEHPIVAADPEKTNILGNWRFHYDEPPGSQISLAGLPFWKLMFRIPHAKMDRDEAVWGTAGRMIRAACDGEHLGDAAARQREREPGRVYW